MSVQVGLQFNKTSAAPGDKIRLEITADTGSNVHVLGVDKSVLLMATGNDITQSQVSKRNEYNETRMQPFISFPVDR